MHTSTKLWGLHKRNTLLSNKRHSAMHHNLINTPTELEARPAHEPRKCMHVHELHMVTYITNEGLS